jgi:hypothetical protein
MDEQTPACDRQPPERADASSSILRGRGWVFPDNLIMQNHKSRKQKPRSL